MLMEAGGKGALRHMREQTGVTNLGSWVQNHDMLSSQPPAA